MSRPVPVDCLEPKGLCPVARHRARVETPVSDAVHARVSPARTQMERPDVAEQPVYGVTTGFGAQANEWLSASQRRELELDLLRSHGLPPFVARDSGINSGFMVAYLTAIRLGNENRRLATSASVRSLSTRAVQADHNSMGWSTGRKLRQVTHNLGRILAIETLYAAQALDLRAPLKPAPLTARALQALRTRAAFCPRHRFMGQDIAAGDQLVRDGGLWLPLHRLWTDLTCRYYEPTVVPQLAR